MICCNCAEEKSCSRPSAYDYWIMDNVLAQLHCDVGGLNSYFLSFILSDVEFEIMAASKDFKETEKTDKLANNSRMRNAKIKKKPIVPFTMVLRSSVKKLNALKNYSNSFNHTEEPFPEKENKENVINVSGKKTGSNILAMKCAPENVDSTAPFKILHPTQSFSPALIEVDNDAEHLNIEEETEKKEFLNKAQVVSGHSVVSGGDPSTEQTTHQQVLIDENSTSNLQKRLEASVRENNLIASIRYCDDFTIEQSDCVATSLAFRQSLQMIPELNFWHSRIQITTVANRRLMVMPYVDIGFPDFIQFNTPLQADRILSSSDLLDLNTTGPNLL
ncbi:hypothetical protein T4C_11688 [Trichinella pseudospiralis]|uniref:Uncharacterized protein n=3 Tax=Trichinella pseudospiralis TaxID=6337 RepID=A0A0V1J146_TRIPS|nr:hypothetical protein T4C_11688 [Trichinella pseudospiralis]